jgi:hypothetical protein
MIDGDSPLGRQYEAGKQENRFYAQDRFYPVPQVLGWLEGLAFKNVKVCQTIFKPLGEITALEPVKPGFGEGSFVAISAQKGEDTILYKTLPRGCRLGPLLPAQVEACSPVALPQWTAPGGGGGFPRNRVAFFAPGLNIKLDYA